LFGQKDYGYDVLIGKQGSGTQLVMNSVYHVDVSPGNIPYSVYESLLNPRSHPLPKNPILRPGQQPPMNFYRDAKVAVPIVVGDSYQGIYRIVGTTTNMFGIDDDTGKPTDADHTFQYRVDQHFEFAEGRCFAPNKFEAIIGSETARKSDLKIGSQFQATHGEGKTSNPDIHKEKWVVVGILKKSFTANDLCVFIPIKTDYTIEDHDKGLKAQWIIQHGGEKPPENTDADDIHSYRINPDGTFELFMPKELWEVSAIFVKSRGNAMTLMYNINNRNEAMAVNPADVMRQFFENFLKIPTKLLLVVACLVSVVAAVGILVSIYNSVSARMREIAIMRALGATRARVLLLICVEAGLVGIFGGILGLVGGHLLGGVASYIFTVWIGRGINWYLVDVYEVYYLLSVVVVALLAGLVPAMKAYRTPVATNLVVV
jgi:putative ABC transport system permease protein